MKRERETGNGKRETGNEKRETGNEERGTKTGNREMHHPPRAKGGKEMKTRYTRERGGGKEIQEILATWEIDLH